MMLTSGRSLRICPARKILPSVVCHLPDSVTFALQAERPRLPAPQSINPDEAGELIGTPEQRISPVFSSFFNASVIKAYISRQELEWAMRKRQQKFDAVGECKRSAQSFPRVTTYTVCTDSTSRSEKQQEVVNISVSVSSLDLSDDAEDALFLLKSAMFSFCPGHNVDFWTLVKEHDIEQRGSIFRFSGFCTCRPSL